MSVVIAMLRGVNVSGKRLVKMETLRALCVSLKCSDVATYVQSGNVVFRTGAKNLERLRTQMESAMSETFGFEVPVVFRTVDDLRRVAAANPFPQQVQTEPGKVLVMFLYQDPGEARREAVRALTIAPEEVQVLGSELYIYYPAGQGQSKLRWGPIEKALSTEWTGRNWNTVLKLLAMAEALAG